MSDARPSTSARSLTSPTEAVCAVDSMPRTAIDTTRADRSPGGRSDSVLGRLDAEADHFALQGQLDPVGELERLAHGHFAGPVVDEVVPFGLLAEAEVFETIGDLRVGRPFAVELQEEERLRHRGAVVPTGETLKGLRAAVGPARPRPPRPRPRRGSGATGAPLRARRRRGRGVPSRAARAGAARWRSVRPPGRPGGPLLRVRDAD